MAIELIYHDSFNQNAIDFDWIWILDLLTIIIIIIGDHMIEKHDGEIEMWPMRIFALDVVEN